MLLLNNFKTRVVKNDHSLTLMLEKNISHGNSPVHLIISYKPIETGFASKVILKLRSKETFQKQISVTRTDESGNSISTNHTETRNDIQNQKEKLIDKNVPLIKNQLLSWNTEFRFPSNAIATYHGKNVSYKWEVMAAITISGKEIETKWSEIILSKSTNYDIN